MRGTQNAKTGPAEAESIAIAALGFLAGDEDRLGRFLGITGLGPENLRAAAGEPGFLASVLGYITEDEALLMAFAENAGWPPEKVARASAQLAGSQREPWEH
jgi:Protein of unknown function (DUF3572)